MRDDMQFRNLRHSKRFEPWVTRIAGNLRIDMVRGKSERITHLSQSTPASN